VVADKADHQTAISCYWIREQGWLLHEVMIVVQVRCAHMTEAVIRRAEDADLAAIVRLRRQWTQEQEGDREDPAFDERLAAWFTRESSHRITWLAEADDRPIGMMNLAIFERMPRPGRASSHWGYLGNAFVLAAYRNQGIGRQLISAVLAYADENGFARVVLSPTERSIPFYERAGFGPANALMLRTPPTTTDSAPRST
jgi:GNAT superfamily N-acetyltransferase